VLLLLLLLLVVMATLLILLLLRQAESAQLARGLWHWLDWSTRATLNAW
jgi:hypothetical protein